MEENRSGSFPRVGPVFGECGKVDFTVHAVHVSSKTIGRSNEVVSLRRGSDLPPLAVSTGCRRQPLVARRHWPPAARLPARPLLTKSEIARSTRWKYACFLTRWQSDSLLFIQCICKFSFSMAESPAQCHITSVIDSTLN